jgi:hypothetical protein
VSYWLVIRRRGKPLYFAAELIVFLLAFVSPLRALANGNL